MPCIRPRASPKGYGGTLHVPGRDSGRQGGHIAGRCGTGYVCMPLRSGRATGCDGLQCNVLSRGRAVHPDTAPLSTPWCGIISRASIAISGFAQIQEASLCRLPTRPPHEITVVRGGIEPPSSYPVCKLPRSGREAGCDDRVAHRILSRSSSRLTSRAEAIATDDPMQVGEAYKTDALAIELPD